MSTSLVHLGDFHAAPGPRNADRYRALEQILDYGASRPEIGAWLWPGDLNDARMTIEDRNRLAEVLLDMGRVAPVVVCYGNHDATGDLNVFELLRSGHQIYVVDRPQCLRLKLATGEFATIFVLPYPQKAGLVGTGLAPGDVGTAAADLLEPIFMQAAAELDAARVQGDLTLMIGHINIAGSRLSSGQPLIGREIELHPKHLDRLGPIYKGLNHIHAPQTIAGAHYAGSVCRLDYGEIEDKRFLVIECQRDGAAWEHRVVSHPIDIAPMFHVAGDLSREGFRLAEGNEGDVERRWHAGDWSGCDVRVRFQYRASEKSILDEQGMRVAFNGALRLKFEGVAIPDRELRAPDVAAAKNLPDKLAAYRKEAQLLPSVAAKLALLQQRTQDEMLVDVERALAAIESPEKATVAA